MRNLVPKCLDGSFFEFLGDDVETYSVTGAGERFG